MKRIDISTRKYPNSFALVDDADYDWLTSFGKWHLTKLNGKPYVMKSVTDKGPFLSMHRLIMGTPKGMQVDHIDNDGLNNQRSNLRICTNAENCMNRSAGSTNKFLSKYKGVQVIRNSIVAYIYPNGGSEYLGSFKTHEDAARAYNEAAKRHYGKFARLNVIP